MSKYTVLIIGSGFGGQAAAINLQKKGIQDYKILERRSFMGGTWCQNTYPGAAVDVQSPLYSISYEPYKWTQMFADGAELREYTEHVITKYGLREKTQTNTNVESMKWNEEEKLWEVQTNQGLYKAQFIINASGPLSTPVIPDFKGKDSFKGESFHTNDWNHDYDYKGKKVAVIGSGASAAQVIPTIAPDVEHMYIFQRTPHWVMPRPDQVFTEFQRSLLGIKWIHKLIRYFIYWKLETRILGFKYSKRGLKKFAQKHAEEYLERKIKDPVLREKVKPDFVIGCKRIILSSALYPAYCRDNVSLLTKDHGIKEITETGIITTKDENIDLDLIVYATGYDATDGVISYPVIGKGGKSIGDFWSDYPRAYLGTSMPDFPNLFIVTGPNTGIGHTSAIFIIEAQMNYIMRSIKKVLDKNAASVEVKPKAEEDYTNHIHEEMKKTVWHYGGCNSWYKSKSGKVIAMFPGFTFTYLNMTKNFKEQDHIFS